MTTPMRPDNAVRRQRIARILQRRPVFRALTDQDMPIMCVAHERGAFALPASTTPDELAARLRSWDGVLVVDDENANFNAGKGPVALVKVSFDGWKLTPEVIKFPWATKQNLLRCTAAFLDDMKRSKDVGVCLVWCKETSLKLMDRMVDLRLIYRSGHVPNGFADSAMNIFNVSGRKRAGT